MRIYQKPKFKVNQIVYYRENGIPESDTIYSIAPSCGFLYRMTGGQCFCEWELYETYEKAIKKDN